MNTEKDFGDYVRRAFINTKNTLGNYADKMLEQRAALTMDGSINHRAEGSIYPGINSQQLGHLLLRPTVVWKEIRGHPALEHNTRIFWAPIPGLMGMKQLAKLGPDVPILLATPTTNNLFPCVLSTDPRIECGYSHAIVNMKNRWNPVLVSIFAGDLIGRSHLSPTDVPP